MATQHPIADVVTFERYMPVLQPTCTWQATCENWAYYLVSQAARSLWAAYKDCPQDTAAIDYAAQFHNAMLFGDMAAIGNMIAVADIVAIIDMAAIMA